MLRAAMSGGLLAAAATLCLSSCSGHAASSQVQPALPGQWGPLGETYVFVTPTQDSPKTVSFNVAGQVPTAVRSEICADTSLQVDGSAASPVHCRWFVDKGHNDVAQLRFAVTAQPSARLRITLRTGSAKLTLNWAPSGFFGGGVG
jgi:hypothetical protein